jgi:predicted RNase H-like HicB family nuclease
MRYIAFIHKDEDSSYGVSFPDFPGCISAGGSLDEALANAAEAPYGHVRTMDADGDHIPEARSLEDIQCDKTLAPELQNAIVSDVPLIRNAPRDLVD